MILKSRTPLKGESIQHRASWFLIRFLVGRVPVETNLNPVRCNPGPMNGTCRRFRVGCDEDSLWGILWLPLRGCGTLNHHAVRKR
jgi:hypothetical protein